MATAHQIRIGALLISSSFLCSSSLAVQPEDDEHFSQELSTIGYPFMILL